MKPPARLLVVRAGALGDFLLAAPLLLALRALRPRPRLTVLGPGAVGPLALESGLADVFLPFESAAMRWLWSAAPPPEGAAWSVDAAVLGLDDPAGRVADRLKAAGTGRVVTVSTRRPRRHVADLLLKAAVPLGVPVPSGPPRLRLPAARVRAAGARLTASGLPVPRLAIHPGSGSPRKNWPAERFLALAREARAAGYGVFFTAGEADAACEASLREAARAEGWCIFSDLATAELAALLAASAAYAGNDSGVTHLAALLGVPTLSLFGPTDPARWAPRGERVAVLRAPEGDLHRLPVEHARSALFEMLSAP